MLDVAKYIRIFNAAPDDELVTKRIASINAIETIIKKKTDFQGMLKLANELVIACSNPEVPNRSIIELSEASLKKNSSAFVAEGQELQLLTCTLIATYQLLEKKKTGSGSITSEDVLAIGLWSGLSFQVAHSDMEKFEQLRSELLYLSKELLQKVGSVSRERKTTKKLDALQPPADNSVGTYNTAIESTYGKQIDSLRFNAVLDREEINILWWALNGWSHACNRKIAEMNGVEAAIVSGLEIAELLRRIPNEAFCHLACRYSEQQLMLNGQDLKKELAAILPELSKQLTKNQMVIDNRSLFPVLNLLLNDALPNGAEYEIRRPVFEWAGRVLQEISITNLNKFVD